MELCIEDLRLESTDISETYFEPAGDLIFFVVQIIKRFSPAELYLTVLVGQYSGNLMSLRERVAGVMSEPLALESPAASS
jgi:hypothetical protein